MKRAILFLVFSIIVFSQAEPIRSALGSKGVEQTEDSAKWENPYITDGLVALWDGEWNAGFGKHLDFMKLQYIVNCVSNDK